MGYLAKRCCCKIVETFPFHNICTLVGKRDTAMQLRVTVRKTVIEWAINRSTNGNYSWWFCMKCEDSDATVLKRQLILSARARDQRRKHYLWWTGGQDFQEIHTYIYIYPLGIWRSRSSTVTIPNLSAKWM
jgi:hypothetical protein